MLLSSRPMGVHSQLAWAFQIFRCWTEGGEASAVRVKTQAPFNAMEAVPQPVVVVGHGPVVGGGIDFMCCCCIRYASKDAMFTIKEVDVGLAADLGAMQRLQKIAGNDGLLWKLAYTARKFDADEALQMAVVMRVFNQKNVALAGCMEFAWDLAAKSPLAMVGTKRMITYNRDHTIQDGLDHIATWNASALQAPGMMLAMKARLQKKTATNLKL